MRDRESILDTATGPSYPRFPWQVIRNLSLAGVLLITSCGAAKKSSGPQVVVPSPGETALVKRAQTLLARPHLPPNESWRLGIQLAGSQGSEAVNYGCLLLQVLAESDPKHVDAACAILEVLAIKTTDPGAKQVLLVTSFLIENRGRSQPAKRNDYNIPSSVLERIELERRIDDGAKAYVKARIDGTDFYANEFETLPILLNAVSFGSEEQAWALGCINQLVKTSRGNERRFWIRAREAMNSTYELLLD